MTNHEERNRDYATTRLDKSSPAHFEDTLARRNRKGSIWKVIFQISTVIGIIALATLILKIFNDTMGYAAIEYKRHPSTLSEGSRLLT